MLYRRIISESVRVQPAPLAPRGTSLLAALMARLRLQLRA
jgi:hypothetical protein